MSNNDSFIDEVTEEVRRDRLYALFRRYGWIGAVVVAVLVGGAAINEYFKAEARAEAEALGDALIEALGAPTPEARGAALAALDPGDNPRSRALVALLAAGSDPEAGDDLWAISEDASLPPLWRDVAALKAAMAASGEMPAAELIARLEPLALPGAPYRLLALEQIALAEISRGETAAALDLLTQIVEDDATGEGLRQRAVQLIVALGGDPEAA
ncbi:MAG: hypothetical protein QNJ13_16920 [Paracoccaceae bacterium]|nr:hypothetical protein [Paracoccaceae bacterium]